ncbi:type III pantothenate kinase [Ancylomarina longa]|uniref:Type III pantothenate kinase n=1 Tax=Ancylomarina longa TaxID=2487017 RepID=A0A434AUL9_9BACT|nr:type III pantothenate kinase [Ancylomarina longa]RUT78156.1 type III pantothenate kinase [Ancylomarina longa]
MSLHLIIDIGNTKTKTALFKQGKMILLEYSSDTEEKIIRAMIAEHPDIKHSIVSSVRDFPESLILLLKSHCRKVFFFDSHLPVPIENLYESKSTLGYDRLAACIGASGKYPNQNILVIDAGTAITFDFVNSQNQYIGGCISPGLEMRFKALNHFTKKLPLLSHKDEFSLIGKNTHDAILNGVQNGIVFEVDSYITKLKAKHTEFKVVITGGDAKFICHSIQNFSQLESDILLIGLNRILEFNLLHSND